MLRVQGRHHDGRIIADIGHASGSRIDIRRVDAVRFRMAKLVVKESEIAVHSLHVFAVMVELRDLGHLGPVREVVLFHLVRIENQHIQKLLRDRLRRFRRIAVLPGYGRSRCVSPNVARNEERSACNQKEADPPADEDKASQ